MMIVGVAGRAGSGKSVLSTKLAKKLDARRVGFGDLIRREATERGVAGERTDLQEVGQELLDRVGAEALVAMVLDPVAAEPSVIVDGVRHVSVAEALAPKADDFLLVYVEAPDDVRAARLATRDDELPIEVLDRHATERELPLLKERAQLVVSGEDLDVAVRDVLAQLRRPSA